MITPLSTNTVWLTLTERVTLVSPYFLMRVQSRSSGTVKRFILSSNTSTDTTRYDKFTITESIAENLTNSTVHLEQGEHFYKVYEQSSSTNLDENLAGTLLEEGILKVSFTADTYKYVDAEVVYTFPS